LPWNGSGGFLRLFSWVADKAAGIDINATRMDSDTDDITTNGFGNCITRDGQGQPTANLPMNNFRHTGAANGVARTDYAALNQAQDGLVGWTIAGGTADAITATYTPSVLALVDGMLRSFRATAANATTTPTFAADSLPAVTITRSGGAAVQIGDIPGNLAECLLRYNLANTRWELLNPAQGAVNPTQPSNLQINAGIAAGVLTVSLKAANTGADPTAGNPIRIPFRDVTLANGDPVVVAVTSALSISTFATGATLGSSNSTPFRLWLVAFNNAGTVVLGLINCSSGGTITTLNETAQISSTAMSGSATSAGVFYTPNGTTITNKAMRILGYVEYSAGLATAGTYGIVPTTLQLFGPGIKKPADTVQTVYATATSTTSGTGANTNMNVGGSITPSSAVNPIMAEIMFGWQANASASGTFFLSRGTGPTNIGPTLPLLGNSSVGIGGGSLIKAIDPATTTTRASYNLFCSGTNVSVDGTQSIVLTELMG